MRHLLLRVVAPVFILALCLAAPATRAEAAGYVVIASKDVPVDSLSRSELQAIFLGEKVRWDKGGYIKIVLPEDQNLLREFLQNVVGKTPSQFDTHWSKLTFTGRAVLPQFFREIPELVSHVGSRRGVISFVPAGQAGHNVKTISVR